MGKHPKPAERTMARALRAELGMPVKQIAAKLGVSVSSVSLWTREIELTPEQRKRNVDSAQEIRSKKWSEANRERRRRDQEQGRERAREGDLLHSSGCMLYWAEGGKERNSVILANSDPQMVRFIVRFLRECFGLQDRDLSIRLNVYLGNGRSLQDIEAYWLRILDLPSSALRTHTVNHFPTSSSGRKKDKLPYGVCTVVVHKTSVAQQIFGAIQEYGGFEEPRWLDGPKREPRPRPQRRSKAA